MTTAPQSSLDELSSPGASGRRGWKWAAIGLCAIVAVAGGARALRSLLAEDPPPKVTVELPLSAEFTDARHGYVLQLRCVEDGSAQRCRHRLAATKDGGKSWSWRRTPVPERGRLGVAPSLHGFYDRHLLLNDAESRHRWLSAVAAAVGGGVVGIGHGVGPGGEAKPWLVLLSQNGSDWTQHRLS